jgi:PAS domain S-box-containing protein
MKLDTKELKTITILYVEDDETVRAQTAAVMKKLFKKVFVGNDGVEGLEIYKKNQKDIDIVVSDINMPNMNGLEMIENINKLNTQIPTVVTTAHTDSKFVINAMDINVDKYMAKPLLIKELTINIVNIVQKYRRLNNIEVLARSLMNKQSKTDTLQSNLNEKVERLQMEKTYLNAIVDNLVLKVKVDKAAHILETSDKFLRFFELSKEEVIGKNINILRCEECTGESFQKLMLKAIHMKKTVTSTYTFTKNDKKQFIGDVTLTPIYDVNMLVSGYIIYIDLL